MNHQRSILKLRKRRAFRVRKRLTGTTDRPRLTVTRSHKHTYAQLVDDLAGKTLAAASTAEKDLKGSFKYGGNKDAAAVVGKAIADRAIAKGIKTVCFDRGRFKYHGRIEALAAAAREAGLQF